MLGELFLRHYLGEKVKKEVRERGCALACCELCELLAIEVMYMI